MISEQLFEDVKKILEQQSVSYSYRQANERLEKARQSINNDPAYSEYETNEWAGLKKAKGRNVKYVFYNEDRGFTKPDDVYKLDLCLGSEKYNIGPFVAIPLGNNVLETPICGKDCVAKIIDAQTGKTLLENTKVGEDELIQQASIFGKLRVNEYIDREMRKNEEMIKLDDKIVAKKIDELRDTLSFKDNQKKFNELTHIGDTVYPELQNLFEAEIAAMWAKNYISDANVVTELIQTLNSKGLDAASDLFQRAQKQNQNLVFSRESILETVMKFTNNNLGTEFYRQESIFLKDNCPYPIEARRHKITNLENIEEIHRQIKKKREQVSENSKSTEGPVMEKA